MADIADKTDCSGTMASSPASRSWHGAVSKQWRAAVLTASMPWPHRGSPWARRLLPVALHAHRRRIDLRHELCGRRRLGEGRHWCFRILLQPPV